jgi:hypothetical protein
MGENANRIAGTPAAYSDSSMAKPDRKPRATRTLDVRALLAKGEEPFRVILATVGSLAADEDLLLVTPFIPAPLIERLGAEGFEAMPERRADGSWQTRFQRVR